MNDGIKANLLIQVKTIIGLEIDDFYHDNNLNDYIDSCVADMISSGIRENVVNEVLDPRIKDMIKLYCKTMFDGNDLPPIYNMTLIKLAINYPEVV